MKWSQTIIIQTLFYFNFLYNSTLPPLYFLNSSDDDFIVAGISLIPKLFASHFVFVVSWVFITHPLSLSQTHSLSLSLQYCFWLSCAHPHWKDSMTFSAQWNQQGMRLARGKEVKIKKLSFMTRKSDILHLLIL